MLEVSGLNHHYGPSQVLFDVNFTAGKGEILGFLGPNGAGKSTTMRILTGFLTPSSGTVVFDGSDIRANPMALRRRLGYLPENVPVYPELTVDEYLSWVAGIKQSAKPRAQVAEAAERCGLSHERRTLIRRLSKGYRQRLGLAQALLGEVKLLILDEPTVGLDPAQIVEIRELIKELGQERTIILSTHILPEVERTCDRALIINRGRIVAEDTPANLAQGALGRGRYLLRLALSPDQAAEALAAYAAAAFVTQAEEAGSAPENLALRLTLDPARDHRAEATALAQAKGWPILEFRPADVSLEEAFVSLVTTESAPEAAHAH